MWILPKNHPLYSAYAQGFCSDLTEDLKQHWEESPEPLLMWKSKPLSWPTLSRAWKRVYWMRYLCGRILKPSLGPSFEEKLIGSLEDTPASLLVMPATDLEQKIPVTYGLILPKVSEQLSLLGASSKTLADTLHSGMTLLGQNYNLWVIELRKEYSQRKKLEHHTEEKDSLSSQSWGTPRVTTNGMTASSPDTGKSRLEEQVIDLKNWSTPVVANHHEKRTLTDGKNMSKKGLVYGITLDQQVRENWQTPSVSTGDYQNQPNGTKILKLQGQVKMSWPTPTTAEASKIPNQANYGQKGLSNHPSIVGEVVRKKKAKSGREINGQRAQEKINTISKNRAQLNPAWVAQLMGTTLEKIFFVGKVTE